MAVALGIALGGSAALVALVLWTRLFGPHVVTGALVGQSELRINWSFGEPDQDRSRYERLALREPVNQPPGPIRTVIYHPAGLLHFKGGTLWV